MDTHCTVNSNRSQNLYWSLLFQQLFLCLFYINSKFATTGVLFSAISPLLPLNIFSVEIWRTVWKQKQWKWAASLSNDDFDKEHKVLSPNALTFCFTFWCICCRLTPMRKKKQLEMGKLDIYTRREILNFLTKHQYLFRQSYSWKVGGHFSCWVPRTSWVMVRRIQLIPRWLLSSAYPKSIKICTKSSCSHLLSHQYLSHNNYLC